MCLQKVPVISKKHTGKIFFLLASGRSLTKRGGSGSVLVRVVRIRNTGLQVVAFFIAALYHVFILVPIMTMNTDIFVCNNVCVVVLNPLQVHI